MRKILKTFSFRIFASFWAVILCCILMIGTATGSIVSELLKDNNYKTANGLLNQVQYFYDSKFNELEEILNIITNSNAYLHLLRCDYPEKGTNYYSDIATILNRIQMTKTNYADIIDSIYYYNEGYDLELYSIKADSVIEINNSGLFDAVKETGSLQIGWLPIHEETVFRTVEPRKVISLYRYTSGTLMCINLTTDIFQKELDYSIFGENCYLAVTGDKEIMVSSPYQERYLLGEDLLWGWEGTNGWIPVINDHKEKLWMTCISLESTGWIVAAVMPEDYLQSEVGCIYKTVFMWSVSILIAASCLAYFISRSVTEPVRFITKQVQQIRENNLDVDFTLRDKESELGSMAEVLNQMVRRMNDLIVQAKEQERTRSIMEIAVLQAQINPHFLYNTLASVQGLIHERENDKAEYLLQMLTAFFRFGLRRGSNKVTLLDEIMHVKSYLEIQKMRYGNCFEYEIDVDKAIEEKEMIRLSLQPIVENSVYHGIKGEADQSLILISAVREKDILRVCVFDDGIGMSQERLANVREEVAKLFSEGDSSVTYGLRNVNQRLILEYGQNYGLEIESVEGEYTMVTMCIPLDGQESIRENFDC